MHDQGLSLHTMTMSRHSAKNKGIKSRYRQQGFSIFEIMVVITLITILMGVFLQRVYYIQEVAEQTTMKMTVMNMRTGLRYKIAKLMIDKRMQDLPNLLDENPINWLVNAPVNYQVDVTDLEDKDIFPGYWYFDSKAKQLVYRLTIDDHFVSKQPGISVIRFKAIGISKGSIQRGDAKVESLISIKLKVISNGQWL